MPLLVDNAHGAYLRFLPGGSRHPIDLGDVYKRQAMFGGVDANGLPHLASANSPLADYPGYLLNYEEPYGAGRIQMIW